MTDRPTPDEGEALLRDLAPYMGLASEGHPFRLTSPSELSGSREPLVLTRTPRCQCTSTATL